VQDGTGVLARRWAPDNLEWLNTTRRNLVRASPADTTVTIAPCNFMELGYTDPLGRFHTDFFQEETLLPQREGSRLFDPARLSRLKNRLSITNLSAKTIELIGEHAPASKNTGFVCYFFDVLRYFNEQTR
jgi:hypothetical protein